MNRRALLQFRRIAVAVLALFFLVIIAGTTVRTVGAGMGCPDWPKCYGQLIPPTDESQLPPDYRERYVVAGRLAEPFDPFKTWVEYINRLLSVVAGLAAFVLVGYAWLRLRAYSRILLYTTAVPILLLIQALLGWRVVATYLAEYMVTVHMIFSVLLTMAVFLAWAQTLGLRERSLGEEWRPYVLLGWGSWGFLLIQVLLGAVLRSAITQYGVEAGLQKMVFYVHRSFSWIVLFGWAYMQWRIYRDPVRLPLARRWALWTTLALLVQVLSGAMMAYVRFTPPLQVLHLTSALFAINAGFMTLYFFRNTAYGGAPQSFPQLST